MYAFVHKHIAIHVYTFVLYFVLASSVISTAATLISPDVTSELYSITVTCNIHPRSTADQCVVRARNNGTSTRTGNMRTFKF